MNNAVARLRNIITALAVVMVGTIVVASPAQAEDLPEGYYICHATANAETAEEVQNWVTNTPADSGQAAGHAGADHQGALDIIPPIPGVLPDGQNWTEYGQAVHANGCAIPSFVDVSVSFADSRCDAESYVAPTLSAPTYDGLTRTVTGLGDNGTPDPGETVTVTYTGTASTVIRGDDDNTVTYGHTYASSPTGKRDCVAQPPAKPVTETHTGCDLSAYGSFDAGTITRSGQREYVWDEQSQAWVLEPESDISWGQWQATPYTDQQYFDNCAPARPAPAPVTDEDSGCDLSDYGADFGAGEVTRDGSQDYVWDNATRTWVLEPESAISWGTWSFTAYTDAEYFENCAPGQPAPEPVTDSEQGCDLSAFGDFGAGSISREGTQAYVWNPESRAWELGEGIDWDEWVFTPWSDEEYFDNCAPPQPEPEPVTDSEQGCDLSAFGDFGAGSISREGTQAYVWNPESRAWELGEGIDWDEWVFTAWTDEEYFDNCAPNQPEPADRTETAEGCDLSAYGEFGAGSISRDGTQAYVSNRESRAWELGESVDWDEWVFTAWTDEEYFDNCAPGQPESTVREVAGSEASCELGGITTWTDVYTTEFAWNELTRAWEPGAETGPVPTNEVFAAYDDAAYFENCAPPQPPDEQRDVAGAEASCELGGQQNFTLTYTTAYEWNPETSAWEAGEESGPVRTAGQFIAFTAEDLAEQCAGPEEPRGPEPGPEPGPDPEPDPEPEVKGVQTAVPTVVDAGLGGSGHAVAPARNPLWLLVLGGGLALMGLAGLRRRAEVGR